MKNQPFISRKKHDLKFASFFGSEAYFSSFSISKSNSITPKSPLGQVLRSGNQHFPEKRTLTNPKKGTEQSQPPLSSCNSGLIRAPFKEPNNEQ